MSQTALSDKIQFVVRKAMSFFAPFVLLLAIYEFMNLIREPGLWSLGKLLFVLYLLPVLTYRVVSYFYPIKEGFSYIHQGAGKNYSPWSNALKIQMLYVAFPFLETGLRLIPGAYSAWLRLWGAKVGKNVFFVPGVTVMDRPFLEIGDNAFIGNRAYLSPHVLRVKNGKTLLYLKSIKIGKGAFIGFDSRIGPGVTIGDGVTVPAGVDLYMNENASSDAFFGKKATPAAKSDAGASAVAETKAVAEGMPAPAEKKAVAVAKPLPVVEKPPMTLGIPAAAAEGAMMKKTLFEKRSVPVEESLETSPEISEQKPKAMRLHEEII